MHNRRKLLIALGAGALTVPLRSFAQQQSKVWRVGFLTLLGRPANLDAHFLGAFPRGMRELGYVEGKNLIIEWRSADNNSGRLAQLAAELVTMKVDVIVAAGGQAISVAQKATIGIPIVMLNSGDPVSNGFVKSLAHPGGNITGLSNFGGDLASKLLEMLLAMAPKVTRVAILDNPNNATHTSTLTNVRAAAQKTGVAIVSIHARAPNEFEGTFLAMVREKAGAVIVGRDALFNQEVRRIAELATKYRLPSIHWAREYVEAGGLISYGVNQADSFRRAATYVDKIFKGAKPADLPVEQPTKLELIINRTTAKALGLKIPESLMIMADEVIE
jgi:putative tryptophan/tyrosine transport system substrate-binding protein